MPPLAPAYLQAVFNVSASASEFAAGLRTALGLTRHGRLRGQLRDSLELFAKSKEHSELQKATEDLSHVINLEAGRLRSLVEPEKPPRKWDWGGATVGSVLAVLIAILEWRLVWPHIAEWWAVVLAIGGGLTILVFVIVSAQLLFERQSA
jgi:hypothetical protein